MTEEQIHVAYCTAHETSLSKLDEHDWQVLSNRWARGSDWTVTKVGRKWDTFLPGFPLFKTKREAIAATDALILAESKWRKYQRLLSEVGAS